MARTEMSENKKLSVVFSFRNEEEVIPELIQRTRAACKSVPGLSHELVFVNDRSSDRSEELLLQEQAVGKDIVIVNMSRRFGTSECVLAGLRESSGDMVLYMDADLQDPPELIPKLIEKMEVEQADVVYTTRTSRDGETWIKLLITRIGYSILNSTSAVDIPYNSGDFKLLSRRVVNHLLEFQEQKPFMRGLVSWVGYKQVQFYYDRLARVGGRTHFPIFSKRVIYNFLDSALISFSDAPLKLILIFGGLMTLGAFAMLVYVLEQKLTGVAVPGWTAIMATVLLLGGFQIMMLGVMGLYLHSIYLDVKRRPLYIIDNVIRSK